MKRIKLIAIPVIALIIAVILFAAPACDGSTGGNEQPAVPSSSAGDIPVSPPEEVDGSTSSTTSAESTGYETTTEQTTDTTTTASEISTTAASTITVPTTASTTTRAAQTTTTRTTTSTRATTTRAATTTTTATTTAPTTTTTTKKATIAWGTASQMKSDCIAIAQGIGYTYDSSLNNGNSHYIDPLYTGAYPSASAVKASVLDFMQVYQSVGYAYCNFSLEGYGDGEYKIWIFVG